VSTTVKQACTPASRRDEHQRVEVLVVGRGRVLFANGDDRLEADVPLPEPAPGLPPMLCVRRVALDEILHHAAAAAGALTLDGWGLKELVRQDGVVAGARLRARDGSERTVLADLAGRLVGRPRGLRPVDTFLREATGPGWVLVGDAGHFKDPAPGQGIADALRQAERLAETVAAGLADGMLGRRLADWWRWRDEDAVPRHAWAHSFGSTGPPPHVLIQAQRDILARPDAAERFWGPSMQRISPRAVLGPKAMLRAAIHGVLRGRFSPTQAVSDLSALALRDGRYRRALRTRASTSPVVAPASSAQQARR
jgi:hypothetical protein